MTAKRVTLIALTTISLGGGLVETSSQKPVKTVAFDHPAGTTEVADVPRLFAASDLVVLGRVVAERAADIDPDEPSLRVVQTAYSVTVQEVFRHVHRNEPQHREPLETIDVIIPHVGDRDRGSHIDHYVSAALNAPQVNSTYLLFLRRRAGEKAWMLTTASGRSIIAIRGRAVAPQDSSPDAIRTAQTSWPDLRRALEALHHPGPLPPGDASRQAPRTRQIIQHPHADVEPVPASLKDLVARSALVVVGTVVGLEQTHRTTHVADRSIVHPYIRLSLRVDDVAKGHASTSMGHHINILYSGGSAIVTDREYAIDPSDYHAFVVGDRAVFLLEWWQLVSAYRPVLNSAGIFRVMQERVQIPIRLRVLEELKGPRERGLGEIMSMFKKAAALSPSS